MNQTVKGMALGIVFTIVGMFLYSSAAHAEWFNSRAPMSDSSTLRRIADSLERLTSQMDTLIEVQRKAAEAASE